MRNCDRGLRGHNGARLTVRQGAAVDGGRSVAPPGGQSRGRGRPAGGLRAAAGSSSGRTAEVADAVAAGAACGSRRCCPTPGQRQVPTVGQRSLAKLRNRPSCPNVPYWAGGKSAGRLGRQEFGRGVPGWRELGARGRTAPQGWRCRTKRRRSLARPRKQRRPAEQGPQRCRAAKHGPCRRRAAAFRPPRRRPPARPYRRRALPRCCFLLRPGRR